MDFKPQIIVNKRVQLSLGKLFLLSALIFSVLITPATTHAGVISFISGLFSGQEASAQTESTIGSSSQDMPLPEPATNFDPSLKASTEMTIDGGEALLPEVGPSTEAPDKADTSSDQISTYTVRSGDTLASVAKMFDVSVNTILWANNMSKGSALKEGQNLIILPISGVMHTVAAGDTLNSIAKKYGGDVTEVANFNDLAVNDKLTIGDTIMIPDGEASYVAPAPVSKKPVSGKLSEPLLVNVNTLPDYDSYYMKPFVGGHRTQGLHGHNAVDYGMPVGSPLYAAADGTIIISKSSGYNGGYGEYVVIQHPNGTQTVYGHMSDPEVAVGQVVKQGQLIGYSGNTGKSTGPHLHFEVRGAKNPF